jgi:transposase
MSQMLVGIDVSMRSNHVLFMGESGESLASFSISNDRIGADTLVQKVISTANKTNCATVRIGMEATSNLGWHLAHYRPHIKR